MNNLLPKRASFSPWAALRRSAPSANARRGTAATEFAITLPLLILFAIAAADIGRAMYLGICLENAVRVGAQRGATRSYTTFTYSSWLSDVQNYVNQELSDVKSGLLSNLQINVSATPADNNLNRIVVSADADYSTILNWPFMSGLKHIHRTVSELQYR